MIKLSNSNRNKKGLVFKFTEKHVNRFFHCNTQEEIDNMFMKLVKERHEEDYWYQFEIIDEDKLQEQIDKLEKSALEYEDVTFIGKAFKEQIKNLKGQVKWSKECRDMEKWLKMAIDEGNAKAANHLCSERMDYQYEGFEYDDAEEIPVC